MEFGIQLYSVRDSMGKDFEGTLKALCEMGYTFVEFAGFYSKTPDEINEILKKYSLKICGTHSSIDDLVNNYEQTVAFHKAIGNKYYIIPWADLSTQEKIDAFVQKVNGVYDKLHNDGITLAFHNHSGEFMVNADGSHPYDQLIYRTKLSFELDTFWAHVGTKHSDLVADRLGDRLILSHIKDGIGSFGKPLGQGTAPVKNYYLKMKNKSIPIVVESETCTPCGLDEAKACIDFLKRIEQTL